MHFVHDIAPSSAETQTLDLVSRLETLTTHPRYAPFYQRSLRSGVLL
ncbi:indoleamine 2, 3-dioxyganeseb, partial [Moniliophthora roreri]